MDVNTLNKNTQFGRLTLGQTLPRLSLSYSEDICEVDISIKDHIISIANHINGRCYDAVYNHELEHVSLNKVLIEKLSIKLKEKLLSMPRQERFNWLHNGGVNELWISLNKEHESIDHREEILRVSRICQ